MKYLSFLKKMTEALERNSGVDTLWPSLSGDERNYLTHNEPRFIVLGGMETFVRKLGEEIGIPGIDKLPTGEGLKKIEAHFKQVSDEAMERLRAIPGFTDTQHITPEQQPLVEKIAQEFSARPGYKMYTEAMTATLLHDDGKILESVSRQWMDMEYAAILPENMSPQTALLSRLMADGNGKAFHYFLHESPEKEKYRAAVIDAFAKDMKEEHQFDTLKHPLILSVLNSRRGDLLADILSALPDEKKHMVFKKQHDIFYNFGPDIARAALKHVPRDEIGTPHPRAGEDRYYANAVRDPDEVLACHAARVGDSELLRHIFSHYPEPEKKAQLFQRDQCSALNSAIDNGHTECIDILLGAISDENRKQLTSDNDFMRNFRKAAERRDPALFRRLEQVLPPEAERSDYQRRELMEARLQFDPEKVDAVELRQQWQTQDANNLGFTFEEGVRTGGAQLQKMIEAMPEAFMEYLRNPVNPDTLSRHRRHVLEAVPDALRKDAEAALAALPPPDPRPLPAPTVTQRDSWYAAHGAGASWINDLPPAVLQQSPQHFNYQAYSKLLPLMQTAKRIEGTFGDAELNACKLATLFGSEKKAEEYLTKFAARDEQQPIHDALLFDLPREGTWDAESWRQFTMREGMGPRALRLLALAPKIEEAFAGKPSTQWTKRQQHDFRQLSLEQLYDLARKNAYAHGEEHPQLANLCIEYGVPEEKFDEARAMLTRQDLPEKNTPDIAVDGAALGFSGFHFKRVEPTHPWCAFIGKLVNCCNYFGGETETMAKAQIEHADGSLYVLTNREGEPIAKCTGWMSQDGNLTFNAWERLSPSYDKFCEPFLLAAAIQAMEKNPKIKRVTLGANKGNAPFTPLMQGEEPTAPELASGDARIQYEVAARDKLAIAKAKLQQLTRKHSRKPALAPGTDREEPNVWQLRQRNSGHTPSLIA